MASHKSALGFVPLALLFTLPAAGPVTAQTGESPTTLDTISVVAPRITYQVERERGTGASKRVAVAEKSAMVSYDDLDLTRTADLYTLEERVRQAADRVCAEVAELFPDGQPDTETCVRRATDDAMARVHDVARRASQPSDAGSE